VWKWLVFCASPAYAIGCVVVVLWHAASEVVGVHSCCGLLGYSLQVVALGL